MSAPLARGGAAGRGRRSPVEVSRGVRLTDVMQATAVDGPQAHDRRGEGLPSRGEGLLRKGLHTLNDLVKTFEGRGKTSNRSGRVLIMRPRCNAMCKGGLQMLAFCRLQASS